MELRIAVLEVYTVRKEGREGWNVNEKKSREGRNWGLRRGIEHKTVPIGGLGFSEKKKGDGVHGFREQGGYGWMGGTVFGPQNRSKTIDLDTNGEFASDPAALIHNLRPRSEERRVGKECRSRWSQ